MAFAFNPNTQPQDKFRFVVGVRFELFYALQTLTSTTPASPENCQEWHAHMGWKQKALPQLPQIFHENFKALGGSPHFWPAIADALEHCVVDATFDEIITYLQDLDGSDFRDAILIGTLHEPSVVKGLVSGELTLKNVSEQANENEHKWLEFLGLRPYQRETDIVRAMECLIHTPEVFKSILIETLQILWNALLKDIWETTYPKMMDSLDEKKQLFETYALPEFLEKALGNDKTVTMKIDEENQTLVCCKGQFRIPFQNLGTFYLMPSIFNSRRFWTFYQNGDYTNIFLPYFEGNVSLDGDDTPTEAPVAQAPQMEHPRPVVPEMDPALIFKALGDNTRYAIISHIAQTPCTAAELSKLLKVSKPTISHHVQLLREAGLLKEKPSSRSIELSLKREVIEHLSQATVGELFNGIHAS